MVECLVEQATADSRLTLGKPHVAEALTPQLEGSRGGWRATGGDICEYQTFLVKATGTVHISKKRRFYLSCIYLVGAEVNKTKSSPIFKGLLYFLNLPWILRLFDCQELVGLMQNYFITLSHVSRLVQVRCRSILIARWHIFVVFCSSKALFTKCYEMPKKSKLNIQIPVHILTPIPKPQPSTT